MEGNLLSVRDQPGDSQPTASVCAELDRVAIEWTQATDEALARFPHRTNASLVKLILNGENIFGETIIFETDGQAKG